MSSVSIEHRLESVPFDTSFFFYEITFATAPAPDERPKIAFAFEFDSSDVSHQTGPTWLAVES